MALALLAVVKADQIVHFEAEFQAFSNGESINPKNSIAPLYPFLDNGVIRVGGRLAHRYSMTDNQRFLLLVSHRSKLATLAINDAHLRTLHGDSHSNSGRIETANLGHSGNEESVRMHQKVCRLLPLRFRANAAAHG